MQEKTEWAGDAHHLRSFLYTQLQLKSSLLTVFQHGCVFFYVFFLIKILQILVSASLLDFYINLNIVFFNREVVPRFLRIIFLGHTTRHTKFDCTVEILPSKFVPQMNCLRKWTNWLAKTYLQTSKGMNLLLAASIFVNVWNSSNRSYLWSQLFLYQTFDRKQHFFYILLQINKRNKANLQRNLKLCRWDARSSAFAWCNQKYMFLRLVDYEKMLDKYFHVFYANVIFVICLSLIYCKRFLCRVFIPFSPSECADFLTWYYQLGQEVVSRDGFQYRSQWNSKPSLFQPLWGGGGRRSFKGHVPPWDWQIAHCCESPKELWRELKLNITVNCIK